MPARVTGTMLRQSLPPISLLTFSLLLLTLFVPPANTRYLRSVSRQGAAPSTTTPPPSVHPSSSQSLQAFPDQPPTLSSQPTSVSPLINPSLQPTPLPNASFRLSPSLGFPLTPSPSDTVFTLTSSPGPLSARKTRSVAPSTAHTRSPSQNHSSFPSHSWPSSAQATISTSPSPSASTGTPPLGNPNSPVVSRSPSSSTERAARVTPSTQHSLFPSILPSPFASPTLQLDASTEPSFPPSSPWQDHPGQSHEDPNIALSASFQSARGSTDPSQRVMQFEGTQELFASSPENGSVDSVSVESTADVPGVLANGADTESGNRTNGARARNEEESVDASQPRGSADPSYSSGPSQSFSLAMPSSSGDTRKSIATSPDLIELAPEPVSVTPMVSGAESESGTPKGEPAPIINPSSEVVSFQPTATSIFSTVASQSPVETWFPEGNVFRTLTPQPLVSSTRPSINASNSAAISAPALIATADLSPSMSLTVTFGSSTVPVVSENVSEGLLLAFAETMTPRESQLVQTSQIVSPPTQVTPSASQLLPPHSSQQGNPTTDDVDYSPEFSLPAAVTIYPEVVPKSKGPSSSGFGADGFAEGISVLSPQPSVSVITSMSATPSGIESVSALPAEPEDLPEGSLIPTPDIPTLAMMSVAPSVSPSSSEERRSVLSEQGFLEESSSPTASSFLLPITPSALVLTPLSPDPMATTIMGQEQGGEVSTTPTLRISPSLALRSPDESLQISLEPTFTTSMEQDELVVGSLIPTPEVSAPIISSPRATPTGNQSASLLPTEVIPAEGMGNEEDANVVVPNSVSPATVFSTGDVTAESGITGSALTEQDIFEEFSMAPKPSSMVNAALPSEIVISDSGAASSPLFGKDDAKDEAVSSVRASISAIELPSAMTSPAEIEAALNSPATQEEAPEEIATVALEASSSPVMSSVAEVSVQDRDPIPSSAIDQDESMEVIVTTAPDVPFSTISPFVQNAPPESSPETFRPSEQPTDGDGLQPSNDVSSPAAESSPLITLSTNGEAELSIPIDQVQNTDQSEAPVTVVSESAFPPPSPRITPVSNDPIASIAIEQEDMGLGGTEPTLETSPSSVAGFFPGASLPVEKPTFAAVYDQGQTGEKDGARASDVGIPSAQDELLEESGTPYPETSAPASTTIAEEIGLAKGEPSLTTAGLDAEVNSKAPTDGLDIESPDPSPMGGEIASQPPFVQEFVEDTMTSLPEASATPDSVVTSVSPSADEPLTPMPIPSEDEEEEVSPSGSSSLTFPSISSFVSQIPSISPRDSPEASQTLAEEPNVSPTSQSAKDYGTSSVETIQPTSAASQVLATNEDIPRGSPHVTTVLLGEDMFEASNPSPLDSETEPQPPLTEDDDVLPSAEPTFSVSPVTSLPILTGGDSEQEALLGLSTPTVDASMEASPQLISAQPKLHKSNSAASPELALLPSNGDISTEDEPSASSAPAIETTQSLVDDSNRSDGVASNMSAPSPDLMQSMMPDESLMFGGSPTASELPSPVEESGTFSVAAPSSDHLDTEGSLQTNSIVSPRLTLSPGLESSQLEVILSLRQSPSPGEEALTNEAEFAATPLSQIQPPPWETPLLPVSSSGTTEDNVSFSNEGELIDEDPSATRIPVLESPFSPLVTETVKEQSPVPSILPTHEISPSQEDSPYRLQSVIISNSAEVQPFFTLENGIPSETAQNLDQDGGTDQSVNDNILSSQTPSFSAGVNESELPLDSPGIDPQDGQLFSNLALENMSGQGLPDVSSSSRPGSLSSDQSSFPAFSGEISVDITPSEEAAPPAAASMNSSDTRDNFAVSESESIQPELVALTTDPGNTPEENEADAPIVPSNSVEVGAYPETSSSSMSNDEPVAPLGVAPGLLATSELPLPSDSQEDVNFSTEAIPSSSFQQSDFASIEASPAAMVSPETSLSGPVPSLGPSGSPVVPLPSSTIIPDRIGGIGILPSISASEQTEILIVESMPTNLDEGTIEPSLVPPEPSEGTSSPTLTLEPVSSEVGSESEGNPAPEGSESNPSVRPSREVATTEPSGLPLTSVLESPGSGSGLSLFSSPQGAGTKPSVTSEAVEPSLPLGPGGDRIGESEADTPLADGNSVTTEDFTGPSSSPVDLTLPQGSDPVPSDQAIDDSLSSSGSFPDISAEKGLPSPLFENSSNLTEFPVQSVSLSSPEEFEVSDQPTEAMDSSSPFDAAPEEPSDEDLTTSITTSTPDSAIVKSQSPSLSAILPSLLMTVSPSIPVALPEENDISSSFGFYSDESDDVLPSTAVESASGLLNESNLETTPLGETSPSMVPSERPEASANILNEGSSTDIQASESPIEEMMMPITEIASTGASPSDGANSSPFESEFSGFPSATPTPALSFGLEVLENSSPEFSGGMTGTDGISPLVSQSPEISERMLASSNPVGEEDSTSPIPSMRAANSTRPTSGAGLSQSLDTSPEESPSNVVEDLPGVSVITESQPPSEPVDGGSNSFNPSQLPIIIVDGNGGNTDAFSSAEELPGESLVEQVTQSPSAEPTELPSIEASRSPGTITDDPASGEVGHSQDFSPEESDLEVSRLPEGPLDDFEAPSASEVPPRGLEKSEPARTPEFSGEFPDETTEFGASQSLENGREGTEGAEMSPLVTLEGVGTEGSELNDPEESSIVEATQLPGLGPEDGMTFQPEDAEESSAAEQSLAPEASVGLSEASVAPSPPQEFPGSSPVVDASPDLEMKPMETDNSTLPDEASQEPELMPEVSEEIGDSISVSDEPEASENDIASPTPEQGSADQSGVPSVEAEPENSTDGELTTSFEAEPQESGHILTSPSSSVILENAFSPSLEEIPEESVEKEPGQSLGASPGRFGDDPSQSSEVMPEISSTEDDQILSEMTVEESLSEEADESPRAEPLPSETIDAEVTSPVPSATLTAPDFSIGSDPDSVIPSQASTAEIEEGAPDESIEASTSQTPFASDSIGAIPTVSFSGDNSEIPNAEDTTPEPSASPSFPPEASGVPSHSPSPDDLDIVDASMMPIATEVSGPRRRSVSPTPTLILSPFINPVGVSKSTSPSPSPSSSETPTAARESEQGLEGGPAEGVESLANPDLPPRPQNDPSVSESSNLPGGVGGVSGIAIGAFFVVAIVGSVVYKSCAVLPAGAGFGISSIFGSSDDGDGGHGSSMYDGLGDDSPWDQVWRSASELPERVVAAGEAAAALVGGEFAGLLKPGAARVRPPQVITRLAVPGMCMALSQLSPGSGGSGVFSTVSGHSSESKSFHSSRFPTSQGNFEPSGSADAGDTDKRRVAGASSFPKVDLLFVFDASGSLSWRDYRSMKEIMTKPGGLIDIVMRKADSGSRIGFIEYAYDSVVVSELDRDEESVRRRILSSFQGDANNWDRDGMYIYEVGEDVGGNALRKVDSLVQRDKDDGAQQGFVDEGAGDIEEPPTVQAKEVPPAMNGLSREAHLALKWCRFEMLPPVANRRIQEQLQNSLRLRRVVVVNAGELTKGGQADIGLEAALVEKREMEKLGIRILTVGIGAEQEKNLAKLATGKSHMSAVSVEGAEQLVKRLGDMILRMNAKYDGKISRNPPAIVKRKWKKRERSAKEKRQQAVYRAVQAGAIDPAKSISKGLPRRASELPPWFTQ